MEKDIVTFGYYICEFSKCPTCLGDIAEKIISISDCLCNHEPQIYLCHGWKPDGDNLEYIEKYFSSKEKYFRMSAEINTLLNEGLFETDGRFMRKEDALHFYKAYFDNSKYILISASTEEKYIGYFDDEIKIEAVPVDENMGEFIGCDIVGGDMGYFHSFLCNSLNKEFSDIKFNSYGLLCESYLRTEQMAIEIEGKGEPVAWLPVMIHLL